MSNGRLKAQYNRVRTSTALKGNDMWNNTIGVDESGGANTAIEATLRAPELRGNGPASGRIAKQQAAKTLIDASGFTAGVSNYEELLALARTRGNIGNQTSRGACKICGGLGHLTKQCHNFISGHTANGDLSIGTTAAAAEAALAGIGAAAVTLLPDPIEGLSDISGLSSSSSSDDSGSDSDSSSEGRRKRQRHKSASKSDPNKDGNSSKHKKHRKKRSSSKDRHKKKKSSSSQKRSSSSKAKKARKA